MQDGNGEVGVEARITFVIPAYNAEKTLERTLDSILWQTDGRYRVVIVDDGSTDRTGQIGKGYAMRHPDRIRYIYQENKRQGGARNTGLRSVETAYVSFLDSDDWLMPEYVERITGALDAAREAPEMIMTLPVIYHEQSHGVRDWYDKELFERIFPADDTVVDPALELRLYQFEVNICRKVLQMDFVKRTGFSFREKMKWEDVYPHFYLLSRCRLCMGISTGFYYRIGEGTQTTACTGSERLEILQVFGDLERFLQREEESLIFPVMRVIVRFAFWCIRMADVETREVLVSRVQDFFGRLPGRYRRILLRESVRQYCVKDAAQYALLTAALRYRICGPVFYDYLPQEICERFFKKILRAQKRVS